MISLSLITLQAGKQGTPYSRHFPRVGGRNPRSFRSPGTPGPALALPPRQAHPAATPRLESRLTLYPAPHQALAPSSSTKQRGQTAATNVPAPTNQRSLRARAADQRPQPQLRLKVKKKKKNPDWFLNPRGGETRVPAQRQWGIELQITTKTSGGGVR